MRERPILFSGPMIRAILEGRKTQTRRVVNWPEWASKESDRQDFACRFREASWLGLFKDGRPVKRFSCRYGVAGDRLWVRETWCPDMGSARSMGKGKPFDTSRARIFFRADGEGVGAVRWRPSIHMPRWASRLTLEITEVRVQRLQDISEEDAKAEGCDQFYRADFEADEDTEVHVSARDEFSTLWDSINAKRDSDWDSNPWVWAISFRRATPEKDSGRQG